LLTSLLLPHIQTGPVDSERHPVSDLLEQLHIARSEVPRKRGSDQDYSQQLVYDFQGHAGQGLELFTEQRNGNGEGGDVLHHERLSGAGYASSYALPYWHAHRSRQYHIEPGGRLHGEYLPCRVEEQDSGVVDAQHFRDSLQQRRKQILECKVGESDISEGLQGSQVLSGGLGGSFEAVGDLRSAPFPSATWTWLVGSGVVHVRQTAEAVVTVGRAHSEAFLLSTQRPNNRQTRR
jgi:hypothetical protein